MQFGPQLSRYDAFLCPTVGTTEIPAAWRDWEDPIDVDGKACGIYDLVMTFLFNVFSRLPCLSVPTGFADNGVPTGVQIVANPYDDSTVFRVAQAVEGFLPLYRSAKARPNLD